MFHGFLARSRASIRSAAENCYRWNSLPPLNNLNQAETRSAASRPALLRRKMLLLCKSICTGAIHLPCAFSSPTDSKKERHACACLSFLEQGTGVEPSLNGLGSRCNTDIPTLRTDGVYHILRVISRRNIHVGANPFIFFAKRRKELRHETNVPDDPAVRAAFVRARARRRAHARRPLRLS